MAGLVFGVIFLTSAVFSSVNGAKDALAQQRKFCKEHSDLITKINNYRKQQDDVLSGLKKLDDDLLNQINQQKDDIINAVRQLNASKDLFRYSYQKTQATP